MLVKSPARTLALGGAAALAAIALILACGGASTHDAPPQPLLQFVMTSDQHYGFTRPAFRGGTTVNASVVNAVMSAKISALGSQVLPGDGGVNAGNPAGSFDFIAVTGDIANRSESAVGQQSAAVSWAQFKADYLDGVTLSTRENKRTPFFLLPGNHDVSNAIGFYKAPLNTAAGLDATSMAEIYNRMLQPGTPRSKDTYNYTTDKVYYSRDLGGVHFVFIGSVWPDSNARAWMESDLAKVSATTPVLVFAHDQPECESKHFSNPNGANDINPTDKFENLLVDRFADGTTTTDTSGTPIACTAESRALAAFLKAHKNVVAYFHGNSNANEFYQWKGPDGDISLNAFRVDSPMKGQISATDETKLSFQVVSIDPNAKKMTVREYLWNTNAPWGASVTVSLEPRAK